MWIIYFFVFFFFALDRLTKYYFVFSEKQYTIWQDFLLLELHKNQNMALSLPLIDFLYYPLIVIIFFCLFYLLIDSYKKNNKFLSACILFIVAGAMSNLFDRIRWGGVIDFISVPWWSVFNLADCYIILGVIFWLIYLFKNGKKVSKKI
jgi:signal peptidase II